MEYWTAKGESPELFQTLISYAKSGASPKHFDMFSKILAGPDSDPSTKEKDIELLGRLSLNECTYQQLLNMFQLTKNMFAD